MECSWGVGFTSLIRMGKVLLSSGKEWFWRVYSNKTHNSTRIPLHLIWRTLSLNLLHMPRCISYSNMNLAAWLFSLSTACWRVYDIAYLLCCDGNEISTLAESCETLDSASISLLSTAMLSFLFLSICILTIHCNLLEKKETDAWPFV